MHGRMSKNASMRAVVQRVRQASVSVLTGATSEVVGTIGPGLCVLVGITHGDTPAQSMKLADKLWNLRVCDDDKGVMNKSVADTSRELLIISQFTLYADTSAGRRPSYIAAARPEHAEPLVAAVIDHLRLLGATVATGRFRTEMHVALVNDGPVTVIIEV
jgi:D-tyrosyl-tRNA(Tyr) deacylase